MRTMIKLLAGAAGLAALTAAAPAASQYYPGYNSYGYHNNYGYNGYNGYSGYNAYNGYNRYGATAMNTSAAAQQCTAAVQNRLYNRTSLGSILGSLVGIPTNSYGRVLSITSSTPTRSGMRLRGLATSGRYASNGYGPYGVGAYGALGYGGAQADLSFRCDVDYRGFVRNVDINRRF
jgi:hypothetical protein